MTAARVAPPLAADERTTLEAFLDYARASVRERCQGVSEADARRAVLPSPGATLAGVVSHLCWVEATWFEVALLGEKNCCAPLMDPDRPGQEFLMAADVPFTQLLDEYDAQCEQSRKIVRTLSLDTAVADDDDRYSVRWILFHMLEETSRQLGHIDTLRELLDDRVGAEPS